MSLTGGERAFPQMFISELFIGSSHSALVSKIKSKKLFQLLDQASISYNSKLLDGTVIKKDSKNRQEISQRLTEHLKDFKRAKKEEFKNLNDVQSEVKLGLPVVIEPEVKKETIAIQKQSSVLECFKKTIQNKWFQLR